MEADEFVGCHCSSTGTVEVAVVVEALESGVIHFASEARAKRSGCRVATQGDSADGARHEITTTDGEASVLSADHREDRQRARRMAARVWYTGRGYDSRDGHTTERET